VTLHQPALAPPAFPTPGRRPVGVPDRRPVPGWTAGPPVPPPAAPRRVTVVSENARIDLALPGHCTIAELLPALVNATGAGGDAASWALHRLAGPALPVDRTVASSGLHDGEVLRLLPAGSAPTEIVFDDFIDAVASNVSTARGRWRPEWSRRVALAVAVAAFAGASTAAAVAPVQQIGSLVAGLVAVLLLVAGVLVARRIPAPARAETTEVGTVGPGATATATATGSGSGAAEGVRATGAAIAAAGMPGLLAAILTAPILPTLNGPERLTAAAAGVVVYALLAAALLAAHRIWFLVAAGVSAGAALAVATSTAGGFPARAAAAVMLVLAVLCTPAFPALSLRLAKLPAPEVPADIATFRAAEQPTPATQVADRTRAAQDALTALLAGATLTVVLAGTVLVIAPDAFGLLLTTLGALALVVRSRAYTHAGQRIALLTGGALLLPASALATAKLGGGAPLLAGVAVLLAGLGCAVHAVRAGRRAPSPYWGRILDIFDFVAVTALIPVAAAVLGLYRSAQSLTG
jgi:type VII secretion integral membrane protein EccD